MPSVASTWDVDATLLAKLQADAALVALVPDGIYFGEAKTAALKFCQVAQIHQDNDDMFEAVAFESILYQIKVVIQNTSAVPAIDAAKRIEAVMRALTPASFTPANYRLMSVQRTMRIRYTERDKANADLIWQHHGAQYDVRMVPTG
jgi:hypothetical protein